MMRACATTTHPAVTNRSFPLIGVVPCSCMTSMLTHVSNEQPISRCSAVTTAARYTVHSMNEACVQAKVELS